VLGGFHASAIQPHHANSISPGRGAEGFEQSRFANSSQPVEVDDARAARLQTMQQGGQFVGSTDHTLGGLPCQMVADT
jgi:hypothetical protein